jgi:hypothetical protein
MLVNHKNAIAVKEPLNLANRDVFFCRMVCRGYAGVWVEEKVAFVWNVSEIVLTRVSPIHENFSPMTDVRWI